MPSLGTVIIVPGFLGSTLSYDHVFRFFTDRLLWLNPAAFLSGAFPYLALPLPDQPDLPGSRFPLREGGPMAPYYGLLDGYLELRGWACESPVADWRRSISYDGLKLALFIRKWAKSGPVKIVCHSRGGLLARWALRWLAENGTPGLVSRVVGLGVPHRGSLNALATLAGYASIVNKIVGLGERSRYYTGYGMSLDTVRHVLRSWPATYELLPDPERAGFAPADLARIYDPASWVGAKPGPYLPYLSAARATWSFLPDPPAGVDWVDVVGIGLDTFATIPSAGHFTESHQMSFSLAGDSTVLADSATVPGRMHVYTPTAHDMLPNDGRLWPVIHRILGEGLSAHETIGGPILRLPG